MNTDICIKCSTYDTCSFFICDRGEISELPDKIIKRLIRGGAPKDFAQNHCRKNEYKYARFILYNYLKKHTQLTLQQIGAITGHDHATVLHAIGVINDWVETGDCGVLKEYARIPGVPELISKCEENKLKKRK